MKARTHAQGSKDSQFAQKYTRDSQGFYVRNEKLPAKALTEKRFEDNVRSLLIEGAKVSPDSLTSEE